MAYESSGTTMTSRRPRLLAQLRAALVLKHLSPRTVEAYVGWVRRYIRFHGCGIPPSWAGRKSPGS